MKITEAEHEAIRREVRDLVAKLPPVEPVWMCCLHGHTTLRLVRDAAHDEYVFTT